ncbi:MAG: NACHT domain-containing protein [Gloeocapsa sp. DLM2.Bin57]|nr:MAG: NACHT domain-containing protein [Gloeocapsa sp. DLM2.Bin57]
MAKRSLYASLEGARLAKQAFSRKGWTQENLAWEINLKTRQPIWRFFSGRPIERINFIEICNILDLNWREIAANPPAEVGDPIEQSLQDLDLLVKETRSQRQDKIQSQCGTLQLLDINYPVGIENIYIDVNFLEEISSQEIFSFKTLSKLPPSELDRFGLGDVSQKQIPGVEAVESLLKVRVLGKAGCGKTTFLQHLAIQCNQGDFASNRVPIFITLRDFAEESRQIQNYSLLSYINAEFVTSGITNPSLLETLLSQGRVLLLLDGLDEVLEIDRKAVLKEIRRFSENYQSNLFVITCRTAAKTLTIKGFTDVEIAAFTQEQITAFAIKWFTALTKTNARDGGEKATEFIEKLNLPENLSFRKLTVSPLFLHLACWIFDRHGQFPFKETEFYKQCLDLLLGKWDEIRGVERDEVYRGFILPQKIKLLSQIAAATFEQGSYFFKKLTIQAYIGDYIRSLPNAPTEPEELEIDSEAILQAIELQHGILTERMHGIFSFSYLAFQEYFTARKIVASYNLQPLEKVLESLVGHITEPRWREIFILTSSMLRSADSLVQLMKQKVDSLVAQDPHLQEFLSWANQKSLATPPTPSATRAFYLALARYPHLTSDFVLACVIDQGIFLDVLLDNLLIKCSQFDSDFAHAYVCSEALSNALSIVVDIGFKQSLEVLKDELPEAKTNPEQFQSWWQKNHQRWSERLKEVITQHQNIQHDWNFSSEQELILQKYYNANQLLMDCLNGDSEVTSAVREEIKAALLLPQKEIEEREWQ